jgi:hypothetical protein
MLQESQAQRGIVGEYYLRGVTEVGSGFLLRPDSSFAFFFSYGALDREAEGKWTIKNNEVIFQSEPRPPHDFALLESKSVDSDSTIVKISDSNELLVRYVHATASKQDTTMEGMTNSHGELFFPAKPIDSLTLVFQFCPEKTSVYKLGNNNNYFDFRFEPWITRYHFNDFHLRIDGKDLKGKHPLLDEKEYVFVKSK